MLNVSDVQFDDQDQSASPPPQKPIKMSDVTFEDEPAPKQEPIKASDVKFEDAPAPTVTAGAPNRPVVNAPTDNFDTRKYLPRSKQTVAQSPVMSDRNAQALDVLRNPVQGQEVSSVTNKPIQSLAERAGGQPVIDAAKGRLAQQQQIRDTAFQNALNAPPEQKKAAIRELAKLGPLEEGEQQQLGITPHYLQSLMDPLFARSEEVAGGVARLGGKIGIPGAQSTYEYLKSAAEEDRLRGNTSGVRGHVGDILGTAGELIPDLALARGVPAGGVASEAYWPAVGMAGAAGRGGNAEDIVKAGLGNVTPILGARLFRGAPLLGRVVANVVLNETTAGMSGGAKDLHSILTNGIMATAIGWHGKPGTVEELQAQTTPEDIARAERVGNDANVVRAAQEFVTKKSPESEAALQQAMVNAGIDVDQAAAVIRDTKSASSTTPGGSLPAALQESTTTPESSPKPLTSNVAETRPDASINTEPERVKSIADQTGAKPTVNVPETQQGQQLSPVDEPAPSRIGQPIVHSDEAINNKPIIAETQDGRVVVHNPDNQSGVSIVKDQGAGQEQPWLKSRGEWNDEAVGGAKNRGPAIDAANDSWMRGVVDAYKSGKITKETAGISDDARQLMIRIDGKIAEGKASPIEVKPSVETAGDYEKNNPSAPETMVLDGKRYNLPDDLAQRHSDAIDKFNTIRENADRYSGGDKRVANGRVIRAGHELKAERQAIADEVNRRGQEVKPNEQPTQNNPAATDHFDHEARSVAEVLNDDNHPFSQALDRIAAGDTSDEAIKAARAAATGLDESSVNDAIDGATRLANKQPTENPEPRSGENPAAQEGVEQPGKTVEPPKAPEFERTTRPPSEATDTSKIDENRHWNFRRSQFSSAESEANFRDLIKRTVAENGEAHKTRVTQKDFVERANEIDPELAKEAIKNYKPGDPVPSREIFHAAAEYAQNNIREAGETRKFLKEAGDDLTQAQRDKLESHAERLEHDAKEAIGGAIGVRSEYGRNLALLKTMKMDKESVSYLVRRADAAAKARGDDLTGKNWQIQRAQIMDQAVRLEQAKMERDAALQKLSEAPKARRKVTTEDKTLSQFVRSRGGFKSDKDLQGEINRLRSRESGTTGLFGKKGLSPDYMREAAVEAGYLPEDATINDLMEKVEQDLRGKKVYSTQRDQGLYDKELEREYKRLNPEESQTWQQRFTSKLDKLEQEARARLADSLNPNTHHDITDLPRMAADLAIILASKLAKKAVSLTVVRKEMEDEFGNHFTDDQDRIERAALEIHADQKLEALTEAAKVPNKEIRKSALAELKGEVAKRDQAAKTEQVKAEKAVKDSQATEAKAATKQAKLDEAARQKQAAADAREDAKKARQAQREAELNEQKAIRAEAARQKTVAAQEANPVYQLGVEGKAAELRLGQPGETATVDDLAKIGAAKLHEPGMTAPKWTTEMQKFGKAFTDNQREIRDAAGKLSQDARDQVKAQQQSRTAAASDAYRAAIKQGKSESEAKAAAREARSQTGALTEDQIAKLKDDYNQAHAKVQAAQRTLAKTFATLEEGKLDKASTAIKAGLISSVRTLGKIVLSHSSFMGMEVARKIPSAITDMALSKITGNDRQVGGLSLTELADAARKGVTRGLPDAYQKLKTGYFPEGEDIYSRVQGSSNPLETREFHSNSRVLNAWVNGIMRTHSAVYSIHRVMGAAMALREQANLAARVEARTAVESGKIQPGEARAYQKMRSDQLFNNPSETMTAHAIEAAEEMAFVNESMASKAVSGVKTGLVKALGGSKVAKFAVDRVLPFTKVPANVAARTGEYAAGTAIAPVRAIYDRISHGEFTPEDQARFVKTFGRGTVGAGIMAAGYLAASKGYATGYVQGYDDKAAIKIGGRTYHTGLIPPLGTLFALGATLYELNHFPVATDSPAGKKVFANAVIGSALKAGEEQPMLGELTKLSDLVDSEDKKKALTKFLGGIAGQAVPTLVSDAGAQIDRTKRQKETVKDYVQERIPFARNYLRPSTFPGREPNKLFDPFASIPANPANSSPGIRLREFLPKHGHK